ncbi:trypsin-like serine peptidase [Hyalangium sp.]|uniref:trypsin-like serine peptidase n=1 Tax=Hyalangium sp. TaxID=2028555 RepID=UPI002D5AEA8D|nr:trypsin-like peptidase domain-containing protein [Hyalangium sp.]HYI02344.1 trypsin-like peptidase domain-containing protein [Hyalangium sp.]
MILNLKKAAAAVMAAGMLAGCGGVEAEVDVNAEERGAGVEVMDRQAAQAEAQLRAAMVANIDPLKMKGYEAMGRATTSLEVQAAFGAEYMARMQARGFTPGPRKALDEASASEGILVLADGRQFRKRLDSIPSTPEELMAPPSVKDGNRDVSGKSLIGTDGKSAIATTSYTQFPFRATGTILSTSTSVRGFCSGALIGPRLVMTAGHCVFDPDTDAWSWNTWFSPGHRGEGSDRFANGTPRRVVGLWAWNGWVSNEDPNYDIGFMLLEDEPRTASLGWFGFGWWEPKTVLDGVSVTLLQYPGANALCADSPLASGRCGAFQYIASSAIDEAGPASCPNLLTHFADTEPGSSGSPTYRWWDGGRWIVGPHAYGTGYCTSGRNKAVRINQSMAAFACSLFDDYPSAYASRSCG